MCYKDTSVDLSTTTGILNIYGKDKSRGTSNGIGKSAVKEAILFALYGKTKVTLSDLIRKLPIQADECKVILTIQVDNKVIDIIRSYKTTTRLVIKVNGKELDFSKLKNKKNYIENLIGMDYDTCVNFSIFDSIRFDDLSSLSSQEIKRLLQFLFNHNKFTEIYSSLKTKLSNKQSLLQNVKKIQYHYYSDKRLQLIINGYKSTTNLISNTQKKIRVLDNLKYTIGKKIASYETVIDKNNRMINWISNKEYCPTCSNKLDNKTKIFNKYQSEINQAKQKIGLLENRLTKVEQGKYSNQETVTQESKKQLRLLDKKNKLILAAKKNEDITSIEASIRKYNKSVDILKKFESYVMQHYLQYLEQVINQYLSKLTDIQCNISFLKQGSLMTRSFDKFSLKLYRSGAEYPYMLLSSGERMLVAYAFKLAINTLVFKDTFLFIDEGLNRLDKVNRYKLLNMLKNSPFNQIFIISHDEPFKEIPLLYIEKENDISQILLR